MSSQVALQPTTEAFQRGLSLGKKGVFRGSLCVDPSEEGIVEIIRNLVEFAIEGHVTEEQLYQDAGIVVGFVLTHPRVFS
jgi:hypothetical protein